MPLTPLTITDLSVSIGDRPVLDGIDLIAQPGRRIALIGENGVGKSTLLRAVTGRLPERARSTGTIDAPTDLVMLGQEPPFAADATIADVLAATLRPLRQAASAVERLAADPRTRGSRVRTTQRWSSPSRTTPGTRTVAPRSPPSSWGSGTSTRTGWSAACPAASAPGSRWRRS